MSAVWDGHIAAPFEMRGRQRTIAACHRSAFAEPVKEWAPSYTLERQIAEARERMGEERWQQLNQEWEA